MRFQHISINITIVQNISNTDHGGAICVSIALIEVSENGLEVVRSS